MLYYLFDFLDQQYDLIGAGVFQYISFRSGVAFVLSMLISTVFGKKIINILKRKQIGETIRDLGLEGQSEKKGTPTMGGIIIILATIIPVLLFAQLDNIYVALLIFTTIWMGIVGFWDDYIKVFKKNKEGLKGKYKIISQIILGSIVGGVLFFYPSVTVRSNIMGESIDMKTTATTVPFFKNNTFDYSYLISWIGEGYQEYVWMVFIFFVVFIIVSVSNGANLTDGMDGLAAGTSAVSVLTLGVFSYVSGNIILSEYLNVMYIPNSGEITVFISSFVGALVGFLWYNAFPAQVFMGDTGSLTIGGIIAVLAISIRKELLLPLLCGVFLIENLSVIIQRTYFKYTKKKYGEGVRVFLMAPLHHHYQKKGYNESKIVTRFWIVSIFLALFCIISLKLR